MKKVFTTVVILFLCVRLIASINVYAPTLESPDHSAIDQMPDVLLNWNPVAGGLGLTYTVQVDTDASFSNPHSLHAPLSAIKTSELLFNQTYYWRVKAHDLVDTSAWSDIRSFTTIAKTKVNPMPGTASNNPWGCYHANLTSPVGFNFIQWDAISGITHYKIQLDTVASFNSSFLLNETRNAQTNRYNFPPNLFHNTTFYIRVKAVHSQGESYWSTPESFRICNAIPGKPNLRLPADMAVNQETTLHLDWVPVLQANAYIIEYDTDNNFTNPVRVNFQPPGGNIMILANSRIQVTGLQKEQTYFWRVKAEKASDLYTTQWSDIWSFTTIDAFPNEPVLEYPQDLAVDIHPLTELSWEAIHIADEYIIEYDTDPMFSSPQQLTSNTEHVEVDELTFGETYSWRVKAIAGNDTSTWSNVHSFTVIDKLVLKYPMDNSTGFDGSHDTLSWHLINGATAYNLRLDTDAGFSSPNLTDTLLGAVSAVTINTDLFNTSYYWQVRAMHAADTSQWSDAWMFNTIDTMPAPPAMVYPYDMTMDVQPQTQLRWEKVHGALSYALIVDNNPVFATADTITTTANHTDIDNLLFGETYYWQVKAYGANDTSGWSASAPFSFTIMDAPFLVEPLDNATEQYPELSFQWEVVDGAVEYIFELSDNATFNNAYQGQSSTNMYNVTDMKFDQSYYWRVKAITSNDTSSWSPAFSLTTIENLQLLSPSDGLTVPLAKILKWETMPGVTVYECQVDISTSFNTTDLEVMHIDADLPKVQAFSKQNQFGQTFYWRVRAINNADTSNWSNTWSFVTQDVIYLAEPADGATGIMPDVKLRSYNMQGNNNYQFELDTLPMFNSFMYNLSFPTTDIPFVESSYQELLYGTTYFWRARARIGSTFSNWSDIWTFTTIENIDLVAPVDGANLDAIVLKNNSWVEEDVLFEWEKATGHEYAVVQWSKHSDFSSGVVSDTVYSGVELPVSPHTLTTGTYYWRVKLGHSADESDWSDTWSFHFNYNVSIDENQLLVNFEMYPNPNKGMLNLDINVNNNTVANLEIHDITGRQVYNKQLYLNQGPNNKLINLTQLSQGIYIIKLENDQMNYNRKLIIKN